MGTRFSEPKLLCLRKKEDLQRAETLKNISLHTFAFSQIEILINLRISSHYLRETPHRVDNTFRSKTRSHLNLSNQKTPKLTQDSRHDSSQNYEIVRLVNSFKLSEREYRSGYYGLGVLDLF